MLGLPEVMHEYGQATEVQAQHGLSRYDAPPPDAIRPLVLALAAAEDMPEPSPLIRSMIMVRLCWAESSALGLAGASPAARAIVKRLSKAAALLERRHGPYATSRHEDEWDARARRLHGTLDVFTLSEAEWAFTHPAEGTPEVTPNAATNAWRESLGLETALLTATLFLQLARHKILPDDFAGAL